MSGFFNNERRKEERSKADAGQVVSLDGRMGRLEDVSPRGARVVIGFQFPPDESVVLELPWGKRVRATVVDSTGGITRLKFDFPIELPI